MVVEHARLLEQRLRERQRASGIAGQQHALGERRPWGADAEWRLCDIGGDFRLPDMGMPAASPSEWPSPQMIPRTRPPS